MFPGLIMGKPKPGQYEESVKSMEAMMRVDLSHGVPVINVSETKWTQLTTGDFGYGTWGHICGVSVNIWNADDSDEFAVYSFVMIFSYIPEKENLNSRIDAVVSELNWRELAHKWDAGDL